MEQGVLIAIEQPIIQERRIIDNRDVKRYPDYQAEYELVTYNADGPDHVKRIYVIAAGHECILPQGEKLGDRPIDEAFRIKEDTVVFQYMGGDRDGEVVQTKWPEIGVATDNYDVYEVTDLLNSTTYLRAIEE